MRRPDNITPLANGRFRVRLWRGGVLYQEFFERIEQARQFRDSIDLDFRMRKQGLPGIVRQRPGLIDLIDRFLETLDSRGIAPATIDYYHYTLAGVRGWISGELKRPAFAAEEFDDRMVERYTAWRLGRRLSDRASKPPSEVQVVKDLTTLRLVYGHARLPVPFKISRRLRRRGPGKRIVSAEERARWLAAMPEGSVERTFAELLANTGMRPSDAAALRRDQVDLDTGVVRFCQQKTKAELAVPISETLARHLRAWFAAERVHPLDGRLLHLDGRPLGKTSLRCRFRRASRVAGVEPPIEHPGLTRNGVISYLLSQGESAYLVAKLVGHQDIRTTLGYARRDQPMAELRQLADRLDASRERP